MRFNLALLFTTLFALIWTASAATIIRRDTISSVLSDLANTLGPHESSLKSAIATVDTSNPAAITAALGPDLTAIDNALKSAGVSINGLQATKHKRQSEGDQEIAQQIAEIITNLLEALQGVEDLIQEFPILGTILGPLLSNIDVDLGIILTGLGILLAGVLKLVAGLPPRLKEKPWITKTYPLPHEAGPRDGADLLTGLAGALNGLGGAAGGILGF